MSTSFRDTAGRAWTLRLDVQTMTEVGARAGVNLFRLGDEGLAPLGALLGDPPRLVNLLYLLLESQAQAAGVSDAEFGRGFDGDVLEAAGDAFVEALIAFSPARSRSGLTKIVEKGRALQAAMVDRAMAELEALDLSQIASDLFPAAGKSSSGGSPAPSASTPAP